MFCTGSGGEGERDRQTDREIQRERERERERERDHLDAGEHAGRGHAEVEVADHLGGRRAVHGLQLALRQVVRVDQVRPRLVVHDGRRLLQDTPGVDTPGAAAFTNAVVCVAMQSCVHTKCVMMQLCALVTL